MTTWAPRTRSRAEQQLGGDRPPRGDLRDHERLELEEAGELLVDAGRRVVAVDERVREREPARPLSLRRPSAPAARPAAAARRRFQRAITFVKALSSTVLVVLVGADDAVDVAPPVVVESDA